MVTIVGITMYNSHDTNSTLSSIVLKNIEALADGESGYSCSASATCFYGGRAEGSVSCTGTNSCTSGYEYVKCDGNTSYCS